MISNRTPSAVLARHAITRRRRRGITLLEVMIAVGVLAVGLLGLASLLPLGQNDMAVALRADRVSSTGRAAFRDMITRGFVRPENWLYPQGGGALKGTPVVATNPASASLVYQFMPPNGVSNPAVPPFCPLVLDPLLIAVNPNNAGVVQTVPYTVGAAQVADRVQLPRISLRQNSVVTPGVRAIANGSPQFTCYTVGLAERAFRSTDDLSVVPLTDKTYRALPQWAQVNSVGAGVVNPGNNVVSSATGWQSFASMQTFGDYSWLAVIEPDVGVASGAVIYPPVAPLVYGGDALNTRSFKVSVVVFYKRQVVDVSTLPTTNPPPERAVNLVFPYAGQGNSVRGNSVEAFLNIPETDPIKAEQFLRVKPEQWIMAKATTLNYVSSPTTSPISQTAVYWYRVVSQTTTVEQADNGGYQRSVRLSGPDWPFDSNTAVGVLMDGAVAVYERGWYTDGNSFWSL
ncbi:MAG: prepilin-type N-terminal cleavage/methylation domain-containing protein [Planctomycetes bacterium]|nr:prepilin-type N-terminal cleavage/methylation domain-containing protein [Planctomycetota bacterium]